MKDSDCEINKNYNDECDQIMREVFHGDDEKIITGLIFETRKCCIRWFRRKRKYIIEEGKENAQG